MIIKKLRDEDFKEVGKIRYVDGKVRLLPSEGETLRQFKKVFWIDRDYTPEDGIYFMVAIARYYGSRSSTVAIDQEAEDSTWIDSINVLNKGYPRHRG
jgi:hypothetical protein